jgi:hypothetical protein
MEHQRLLGLHLELSDSNAVAMRQNQTIGCLYGQKCEQ